MKFTQEEQNQLDQLAKEYPVVERLLDTLNEYEATPFKRFERSMAKLVTKLCDEADNISEGKAEIINGKEKTFERVMKLIASTKEVEPLNKPIDEGISVKNKSGRVVAGSEDKIAV